MSQQDLKKLLAQLHAELDGAESMDADSKKLLATVSMDIEKALAREERSESIGAEPLETLATRFEADHPELTGVLRQIIDTLAKAGI